MKIYTRTGDDGTTGLFGGARVSKRSLRVDAYGTLDEANAALGRARAALEGAQASVIDPVLASCQVDLFTIGAEIATLPGQEAKLARHMALLPEGASERLERAIDEAEKDLPPLTAFVLPAGSRAAAELHYARCVARRAERLLVALAPEEPVRREVIVWVNRLSDLLFTLARQANRLLQVADVPWTPSP